MAMKRGDLVREWSAEDYEKPFEVNRLLRAKGGRIQKSKARLSPRVLAKAHPKLFAIFLVSLMLSIGAYAYAAVSIQFPSTPAHGVLLNCGSTSVPSKTSVVINSTGAQLVTCPGGAGLFRILAGTNATANYTLPSPYLDLYAYPAGQDSVIISKCTDAPAAIHLARSWNAGFTGNYSLCADYGPVGASGLPGFVVNWTVS